MAGVRRIALQKRAGLDEDAEFFRAARVGVGVFAREFDGQPVVQFGDGGVDRRGVRELGKDDEAHWEERLVTLHRSIDEREIALHARGDLRARRGVRRIELNRGGVVTIAG